MRSFLATAVAVGVSLILIAVAPPASAAPNLTITASPNPAASGSQISASYSGTLIMPSGSSTCGQQAPFWSVIGPGESQSASGPTFSFRASPGGLYIVQVLVQFSSPQQEDCSSYGGYGRRDVSVYEPPKILGLSTLPDPPIVDRETGVFADAEFPRSGATVTWNFGDNTSCTNCSAHTWTTPGTYDAKVTLTNPAGSVSGTLQVAVKADPPVVSAGFDPSPHPKAGEPVQFTSVISGGTNGRTILWDFGDGTTSSELNPKHTFVAADDYAVSLTVTNKWGSGRWNYPLEVFALGGGAPPDSASFSFTPVSPVTNQRVSFLDQSKGSITRWRWSFDDGTPAEYVRNPTHTFTQFGRKNVGLTVSNAFGRKAIVLFVDVLRDDVPPLASFSWTPFSVTVGQPVQFTDESFGATAWLWDLGEDGATSSEQNPRRTYRTAGQKAVTLKATNAHGSGSVTKFFPCHETTSDKLEASFTWSPLAPNPGQEVQFLDASGGSPEKWSWVVSDGAQSTQKNWSHTFAQPGEYAVSLRVDRGTETNIRVQTVRVGATAAPVPNFTWTPGSPQANEPVSFRNLSLNATAYSWDFGDGATSTAVDPEHRFAAEKTYRVRLTASNAAGASESLTKDVTVGSVETVPVASFTATPNPAKAGTAVRFNDTSIGRPSEWLWDFAHDNATSRSQNPQHTFPFAGTFLVKLTVTNSKGSSSITLPVVMSNDQQKPAPDFTYSPSAPAAGQLVEFTDKSANDPKGWHWIFEDGDSANGAVVAHTFARAGNWRVTLEVSNEAGLSTLSRTVGVSEATLQADFAIEPEKPVVGQFVTFRDTSRGKPDSWQWIIDRVPAGTTRDLQWTFDKGGEHVVELQVMRVTGEKSIRQQALVVAAPPVASFKATGALVTGSDVTFTDTSTGSPSKRIWSINGLVVGDGGKSISKTFSSIGFMNVRLFVENAAGADSVTQTYSIRAKESDRPRVLSVAGKYGPCFYSGMTFDNPMTVDVDWRNKTPARLDVEVNGVAGAPIAATAAKTAFTLDSSKLDYTSEITENRVLFTASSFEGAASEPQIIYFFGAQIPGFLRFANVARDIDEDKRKAFTRGIYLPPKPLDATIPLPQLLGGKEIGIKKTQFKLEEIFRTDCSVVNAVEIAAGLAVGPGYTGIRGSASFETRLSKTTGILSSQKFSVGLDGFTGFEQKQALLTAIPGMAPFCALPIVSDICDLAQVKLDIQGSIGGVAEFDVAGDGTLNFKGKNYIGKLAVTATGALDVGSAKLELFGGGKGAIKFGGFDDPHFFKKVDMGVEFGARFLWFGTLSEYKHAAACTYEPGKDFTCGANASSARGAVSDAVVSMRPLAPLGRKEKVEVEDAPAPILLGNVSPLADPATAVRGERSVVVYLSENEASGAALQRLDVRAMRRSTSTGNWSAPASITSDAIGDFNPAVAIDSRGRVIAAWERIRNASLSYADIPAIEQMPKLLREVEIAVAASDTPFEAPAQSWSAPVVLTTNDLFDHQPALAALADGRTILAWLREPADGKGPQDILVRVLENDAWSPEQRIATALRGVGELALATRDNEAQLVVAHDRELTLISYRDGSWSAPRNLTADDIDDRSPAVLYDHGVPRIFWTRGKDLVTRLVPSTGDAPIEIVRTGGDQTAVAQPVPVTRPDGTPAVVWSSGSELRALLFDPAAKEWSRDIPLAATDTSHTSLSASFSADGALHVLTLGGASGRSDLMSYDLVLNTDLAARGETITVEPRAPKAGERVTFAIDVINGGTLPVRDVRVDLQSGETSLASTKVTGGWMPGEVRRLEWTTIYDPTRPELSVVVDPLDDTHDTVRANNRARFSFANRPPSACAQASIGSGGVPLPVSFDAGCSVDTDGAIAHYAWSFSEGDSASGSKVVHTFDTPGTHTAMLTVTDDMGARSSYAMTIDVAAAKDWRKSEGTNTLHLPVVGRAAGGGGSYFVSDLALLNTDSGRDLTIDAVFLPDGRGDAYHRQLTLAGGELLQTRDVLARLFGATNGTGSLRLDLSHPHAVAVARIYNDQPTGTAGFSSEAVAPGSALAGGETGIILQHWLPGYRTNVGFTEVRGLPTFITVRAFDENGAKLGSEAFALGPYEHSQVNGRALFQHRGRIEVEVKGGAALAYASTVDEKTGDPIFQAAQRPPDASGPQTLLIPVVARLAGANDSAWRSDVRIFNPASAAQQAVMELRTTSGAFTKNISLAAGETASFDDVIARAFPQLTGNVGGALAISAAAPLMASSRTFNLASNGTYGLYVPARSSAELVGEGETAWLVQLQENATYRCNLGITSFEGPVEISVRAFDAAGTTLATKTYGVAAGQNAQIGRVFADMGVALPLEAGGLEVMVTQGRAFIYASVNDNRTGDGTFVEARR
jgi:PKD repeat protein